MKKTYPTSTKSQQWAQHLRPFGKRLANKSTRKINKEIAKQDDVKPVKPAKKSSRKRQKFAIEFTTGNENGKWRIWKKYIYKGSRDSALESTSKKHRNSTFGFMNQYKFRALDYE